MTAYYNENDPYAATWLEILIFAGEIAYGHVDRRSIKEVTRNDISGFTQVHLFAGLGGWSLGLRLAGWPDDRPVWTGSCPCQPFSQAGARRGVDDERHLWPYMHGLVAQCQPATVFGEQVASKDGRQWLAGVRVDLEALDYAVGAADLCAAGAGAPHIRQRLYWLADAGHKSKGRPAASGQKKGGWSFGDTAGCSPTSGLAHTGGRLAGDGGVQRGGQHGQQPQDGRVGGLGHADDEGPQGRRVGRNGVDQCVVGAASLDGWSNYDIVHCTDGKARRFEPGSFPLAHGVSNRVGRLRAYGNAIVPQVAATFIASYMDLKG